MDCHDSVSNGILQIVKHVSETARYELIPPITGQFIVVGSESYPAQFPTFQCLFWPVHGLGLQERGQKQISSLTFFSTPSVVITQRLRNTVLYAMLSVS